MKIQRILFKDKLGNRIVEKQGGGIGLENSSGKLTILHDFKDFVKEHRLGKEIRFHKKGNLWASNKFLRIKA